MLDRVRELLARRSFGDNVWLPYLGDTLDAGVATLFAFEVIEACKYLIGPHPVDGIWLGAAGDVIMRERGIEFVDGSAPGFAAVVGAAPTKRRCGAHRARVAGKEPLRLHGRPHQRRFVRRAIGGSGRAVGLGNAPGAVRQRHLGRHLRAGICQPRGAELRQRASRATTSATCSTTRTASSPL